MKLFKILKKESKPITIIKIDKNSNVVRCFKCIKTYTGNGTFFPKGIILEVLKDIYKVHGYICWVSPIDFEKYSSNWEEFYPNEMDLKNIDNDEVFLKRFVDLIQNPIYKI